MAEKKWAQNVKLHEGKLKDIGWPSYAAIKSAITSGKVDRKTATSRLVFIANMGNTKAKAMLVRLKKELDSEKKK